MDGLAPPGGGRKLPREDTARTWLSENQDRALTGASHAGTRVLGVEASCLWNSVGAARTNEDRVAGTQKSYLIKE